MRIYVDIGVASQPEFLTLVILVFAEVTPKTIASLFPERGLTPAVFINDTDEGAVPLVILVNFINGFIRILGVKASHDATDHLSSEELRTAVMKPEP